MLLTLQSLTWTVAGLSALPFAFGGEVFMIVLGAASLLLALGTSLVGVGVLWRKRWARRTALALEATCLFGSLLLLALPVGADHGIVSWMVNVALPLAVMALLRNPAAMPAPQS